jgi:hypothetical protein
MHYSNLQGQQQDMLRRYREALSSSWRENTRARHFGTMTESRTSRELRNALCASHGESPSTRASRAAHWNGSRRGVKRGNAREPLFGGARTAETRTIDLELFPHHGWLALCSTRRETAVLVRGIGSVAGVAMTALGLPQG